MIQVAEKKRSKDVMLVCTCVLPKIVPASSQMECTNLKNKFYPSPSNFFKTVCTIIFSVIIFQDFTAIRWLFLDVMKTNACQLLCSGACLCLFVCLNIKTKATHLLFKRICDQKMNILPFIQEEHCSQITYPFVCKLG